MPDSHPDKTAAYRLAKKLRGECRDCRAQARRRVLPDGTVKILNTCDAHGKADALRKKGQIK